MIEKILTFISENSITSKIYTPVYKFVEKWLSKVKEILSEKTYEGIITMVDKITGIVLVLLLVYIVYSLLLFLYSLLFKKKFRIMLLISLLISLIFFLALLAIYAYINI